MVFPIQGLQLFLGQAVLARRPVVDRYAIAHYGRRTGSAEVRVQNRRMRGHPAVLGEILHALNQRRLAAVLEQAVSVGLNVGGVVVEERLR